MSINKIATDPSLTDQEKNWELMSVLGLKWSETIELSEEDKVVVKRAKRIQKFLTQKQLGNSSTKWS